MSSSRQARATRTAISPRLAIKMRWKICRPSASVSNIAARSHAEDAEACLGDRRPGTQREAQRERLARVDRVEDAVVPEAGRGVVGAALVLVLGERGRLERRLLLWRQRLAARRQLIEAHGQ